MSQSSFVSIYLSGYTYDLLVNSLLVILFLNESELICLHASITICRSLYSDVHSKQQELVQQPQLASSWQTKNKMGCNPKLNL